MPLLEMPSLLLVLDRHRSKSSAEKFAFFATLSSPAPSAEQTPLSSRFSSPSVSDSFALLPAPGPTVLSSPLRRTAPAHLDIFPPLHSNCVRLASPPQPRAVSL